MSNQSILDGWNTGLSDGRLRFPRCRQCGHWNWYPLPSCKSCGSAQLRWTEVAPVGTVYSWTRIHRNFGGEPVAPLPYITALIDIADAMPVRLTTLWDGTGREPRIGSEVSLSLDEFARWTSAPKHHHD